MHQTLPAWSCTYHQILLFQFPHLQNGQGSSCSRGSVLWDWDEKGLKGLQLKKNCTLLTMAALLNCFQLMHYSVNLAYHWKHSAVEAYTVQMPQSVIISWINTNSCTKCTWMLHLKTCRRPASHWNATQHVGNPYFQRALLAVTDKT